MSTINRDINDPPINVTLAAGVSQDIVFRCLNNHNVTIWIRVTGNNPVGTCDVYLGPNGDATLDVMDVMASTMMANITTKRLFEAYGTELNFITLQLTSLLGTTVKIISNGGEI